MNRYDQYYVAAEGGDVWLYHSPTPDDEGEEVGCLGDAVNVQDVLDKIRADQERRAGA